MGGCSEAGLCLYVIHSACVTYQKFCNMDLSLYINASHSHHSTITFTYVSHLQSPMFRPDPPIVSSHPTTRNYENLHSYLHFFKITIVVIDLQVFYYLHIICS